MRKYIEEFCARVDLMGGICAVNLNEPSPGDLERLNDAYLKVWNECADLKEENARLKELAWNLDDHTIHARNKCEFGQPCECGLQKLRDELRELTRAREATKE